jgi:hypothetical protein
LPTWFAKSKSTIANLVTYLDFVTLLGCSQHQVDVIYFDLSSAPDLVLHGFLLHRLNDYLLVT